MKESTKKYLFKILRTFIQAFVPALCVGIKTLADDKITMAAIITIVIPAVAAGLCAVMNVNDVKGGDENEV